MRARIIGVQSFMATFEFYFACSLSSLIFSQVDNLSKTLQNPRLSASENYSNAQKVISTLGKDRNEESFDLWWISVIKQKEDLEINEPIIKRKRKIPRRFEVSLTC